MAIGARWPPGRPGTYRRVPPATGHRHGGRRADRRVRERRKSARWIPRPSSAGSGRGTRAHPALRASVARGSRDRRSRPQSRPVHDEGLHRPRHAIPHPAPPAPRADQDLVIGALSKCRRWRLSCRQTWGLLNRVASGGITAVLGWPASSHCVSHCGAEVGHAQYGPGQERDGAPLAVGGRPWRAARAPGSARAAHG